MKRSYGPFGKLILFILAGIYIVGRAGISTKQLSTYDRSWHATEFPAAFLHVQPAKYERYITCNDTVAADLKLHVHRRNNYLVADIEVHLIDTTVCGVTYHFTLRPVGTDSLRFVNPIGATQEEIMCHSRCFYYTEMDFAPLALRTTGSNSSGPLSGKLIIPGWSLCE